LRASHPPPASPEAPLYVALHAVALGTADLRWQGGGGGGGGVAATTPAVTAATSNTPGGRAAKRPRIADDGSGGDDDGSEADEGGDEEGGGEGGGEEGGGGQARRLAEAVAVVGGGGEGEDEGAGAGTLGARLVAALLRGPAGGEPAGGDAIVDTCFGGAIRLTARSAAVSAAAALLPPPTAPALPHDADAMMVAVHTLTTSLERSHAAALAAAAAAAHAASGGTGGAVGDILTALRTATTAPPPATAAAAAAAVAELDGVPPFIAAVALRAALAALPHDVVVPVIGAAGMRFVPPLALPLFTAPGDDTNLRLPLHPWVDAGSGRIALAALLRYAARLCAYVGANPGVAEARLVTAFPGLAPADVRLAARWLVVEGALTVHVSSGLAPRPQSLGPWAPLPTLPPPPSADDLDAVVAARVWEGTAPALAPAVIGGLDAALSTAPATALPHLALLHSRCADALPLPHAVVTYAPAPRAHLTLARLAADFDLL